MTALFVTASGTDIGKTHIAEHLIRAWRADDRLVWALKPIASGFDAGDPEGTDTVRLLRALGEEPTPENIHYVSPWRYAAALSPDMAAALENQVIPFDDVVEYCRSAIRQAESDGARLLIEGIGGVMVPIDGKRTVLDLIAALDIPALLVTGSYLGSLSHTLTAFEVLKARGVTVDGIIVNETPNSEVPLEESCETLRRFVGPTEVDPFPHEAG